MGGSHHESLLRDADPCESVYDGTPSSRGSFRVPVRRATDHPLGTRYFSIEGVGGLDLHVGIVRGHHSLNSGMMGDPIERPTLYIFSGLPGSGKTTLAAMVAKELKAAFLRIDTVEQGLRDLCSIEVRAEGYGLAYRVAADNLHLGVSVVADSCNPVEGTRREWERIALDARAAYVNVEIVCSNHVEHRRRVESRKPSVPGLRLPSWREVEQRDYSEWTTERIVVDTAGPSEQECFAELMSRLRQRVE